MKHNHTAYVTESASNLHVVEVDPQTDPRWEAFVTSLPDSLIYHHPAWLQVLEEAYGYEPVHLACEDTNGELRGILPLFYSRRLLTGRRFLSLPRTSFAGPLAHDNQAMAALVHAAVKRTRDEPGAQLRLTLVSDALDGLVDGVVGVPVYETYQMELPERPEFLQLDRSRRKKVNKAARMGVHIRPAETERELRAWYELYLDTMRSLPGMPRPYHFFEIVWRRLRPRGLMRLLLAEQHIAGRSKLLAGTILLMFGQTIYAVYTGWRREDWLLRPNDALHWQTIQDASAARFRRYELGEVPKKAGKNNSGLANFKSEWGAEPKSLYRYYYPVPHELEISILNSSSRVHQFATTAWRRLPIKATVLLGNWAHHHF